MKCVISWRTEHQVYELPDNHELLVWLDKREKDDSVPFLLSICQAGETPNSSQPPVKLCNSQGSQLCDQRTCFACEEVRAFERKTGSPKRLTKRFHCALSRMEKNGRKRGGTETDDAKAVTLMPAL
ncbi:DEMETER-like protein 3 [Populus alba x Populus x berolinensis]|nr:DEMETER-like protein 3 [Populus alba x Populus x berolinensis]